MARYRFDYKDKKTGKQMRAIVRAPNKHAAHAALIKKGIIKHG